MSDTQAPVVVTPFYVALVEKAMQAYIDGSSDKTLPETARDIVAALDNPCAKIFDHKWLDPECVETGCQSLIWKSRYEAAVKGRQDFRRALASERADHISTQSSIQARIEELEAALREAETVFALVEHPAFPDPDYQMRIEALGDQIGYGALMAGASAAWRKTNIVEGSEFVAGPCQITVTNTLKMIRATLSNIAGGQTNEPDPPR